MCIILDLFLLVIKIWVVQAFGGKMEYDNKDNLQESYYKLADQEFAVTQPSTLDQVSSLGCWRDAANRAITSLEGLHPLLRDDFRRRLDPVKRCAVVSQEKGFSVFALQNGGHCMADANMNFDRYGPSNLCRDGRGGIWANSVYSYRFTSERRSMAPVGRGLKIKYCQKPLDIALLLDGSGKNDSYNLYRWEKILGFAKSVLLGFDNIEMHSSVIAYGDTPKIVVDMNEDLLQRNYINNLPNVTFPGGIRTLNDALKLAWKEQFKKSFRVANKVIIALVTGDLPSGLTGSSQFLSKKGVRVIAVGIDEDAHYRFLQTVASGRFPRNIFSLSTSQLEQAAPYLVQEVCRVAKWKGRRPKKKTTMPLPSAVNNSSMDGNVSSFNDADETKKYLAPAVIIEDDKPATQNTSFNQELEDANRYHMYFEQNRENQKENQRKENQNQKTAAKKHRTLPYFNAHRNNTNVENFDISSNLGFKKRTSFKKKDKLGNSKGLQELVANAIGENAAVDENKTHTNVVYVSSLPKLEYNPFMSPGEFIVSPKPKLKQGTHYEKSLPSLLKSQAEAKAKSEWEKVDSAINSVDHVTNVNKNRNYNVSDASVISEDSSGASEINERPTYSSGIIYEGTNTTATAIQRHPTMPVTISSSPKLEQTPPTASLVVDSSNMNEGNELIPTESYNYGPGETKTSSSNLKTQLSSNTEANGDDIDRIVTGSTYVRFEETLRNNSNATASNLTHNTQREEQSGLSPVSESFENNNSSSNNLTSTKASSSEDDMKAFQDNKTHSNLANGITNSHLQKAKNLKQVNENTYEETENETTNDQTTRPPDEDHKSNVSNITKETKEDFYPTAKFSQNNTNKNTTRDVNTTTSHMYKGVLNDSEATNNATNLPNATKSESNSPSDVKQVQEDDSGNFTKVSNLNESSINSSKAHVNLKAESEASHGEQISNDLDQNNSSKGKSVKEAGHKAIAQERMSKLNQSLVLMADGEENLNAKQASNHSKPDVLNSNHTKEMTNASQVNGTQEHILETNKTSNNATSANTTTEKLNSTQPKQNAKGTLKMLRNNKNGKNVSQKEQVKEGLQSDKAEGDSNMEKTRPVYPESEEAIMSEDVSVKQQNLSNKLIASKPAETASTTALFAKPQKTSNSDVKDKKKETPSLENNVVSHMINPIESKIKGTPKAKQTISELHTTESPLPTPMEPLLTTMSLSAHTHPSNRPYIPGWITRKKSHSQDASEIRIKIKENDTRVDTSIDEDANARDATKTTGTSFDLSKILPSRIDTGKYFISHIGGNEFVLTLKSDNNVIEESDGSGDKKDPPTTLIKESENIQDAITRANVENGKRKASAKKKRKLHKGHKKQELKEVVIKETTDNDARMYKLFLNVVPKMKSKVAMILPNNFTENVLYKRTRTERAKAPIEANPGNLSLTKEANSHKHVRVHRSKVSKYSDSNIDKRVLTDEEDGYDYSLDDVSPDNSTQDDITPSIIEDSYDQVQSAIVKKNSTEAVPSNSSNVNTTEQKVVNETLTKALLKNETCNKPVKVLYVVDVSDGLGLGPTREKRWKRLKDFIQDVNVEILDESTLGYVVYDVEPRFLRKLSPCDEQTEYFVTSNPCLCERRDPVAKDAMASCSTVTPTRQESIEDFGVLGPRTGKAIDKARSIFKEKTQNQIKKLIILITHKMAADDVDAAERTLKDDGISLIDIEIGNRKEYYARQRNTIYKRSLDNQRKTPIPEDHKLQVSFQGLQKALSNIFYKICTTNMEGKNLLDRRHRIVKHRKSKRRYKKTKIAMRSI